MKAIWNGNVIAESKETVVVEGNHYFPPSSIRREFFKEGTRQTVCPWKGTANYYHLIDAEEESSNAAWYYSNPKDAAAEIKDHIAFYPVVQITD